MIRSALCAFVVTAFASGACASDLSQPYSPTRAEWLENLVLREVRLTVDVWKKNATVAVSAIPDKNLVSIVLVPKTEQEFSPSEKSMCARDLRDLGQKIVRRYEWAADVVVSATCW